MLFWAFWLSHTIIAACAAYDVVVRGFRPGWRDLGIAVLASLIYVALVLPIDLWLGADYGFVGNPPAGIVIPPFVLALGPWPQRAIILVALVPIGFVVVLLPWLAVRAFPNAVGPYRWDEAITDGALLCLHISSTPITQKACSYSQNSLLSLH